jgi:hypothetical protein
MRLSHIPSVLLRREPEYATEDSTRSIYKLNICGVTTTTVAVSGS